MISWHAYHYALYPFGICLINNLTGILSQNVCQEPLDRFGRLLRATRQALGISE